MKSVDRAPRIDAPGTGDARFDLEVVAILDQAIKQLMTRPYIRQVFRICGIQRSYAGSFIIPEDRFPLVFATAVTGNKKENNEE